MRLKAALLALFFIILLAPASAYTVLEVNPDGLVRLIAIDVSNDKHQRTAAKAINDLRGICKERFLKVVAAIDFEGYEKLLTSNQTDLNVGFVTREPYQFEYVCAEASATTGGEITYQTRTVFGGRATCFACGCCR